MQTDAFAADEKRHDPHSLRERSFPTDLEIPVQGANSSAACAEFAPDLNRIQATKDPRQVDR